MTAHQWMSKHPCLSCDTGYGMCSQGWVLNLMCCEKCDHPSQRQPNPWTHEDYVEMWTGKEIPPHVAKRMEELKDG